MKLTLVMVCLFAGISLAIAQNDKNAVQLKTKADSISYYLGLVWSSSIPSESHDLEFNYDAMIEGFKTGKKLDGQSMEAMEAQQYLVNYFQNRRDETMKKEHSNNIEKNKAFLEENKSKDGVVTLESGVQYKIITQGTGEKPALTDDVKVHYSGSLIDNSVFDSSVERGEPITLNLQQVIPGWTEVLQLMPVGSKWMVYIPEDKGYGSRDMGVIPPFSTLIFEIELLEIIKE